MNLMLLITLIRVFSEHLKKRDISESLQKKMVSLIKYIMNEDEDIITIEIIRNLVQLT